MCWVDDSKLCQIHVYFDLRRPSTPQELIKSRWADVNVLKEKILLLQPPLTYDATVTTVCTICTIAAAAAVFSVQIDDRHRHKENGGIMSTSMHGP